MYLYERLIVLRGFVPSREIHPGPVSREGENCTKHDGGSE